MSYLVLARKYRPQRFEELVGQEHVARTLVNAITEGRVHHAFLFTGARGVGKTSAARILAKALSCQQGPTTNPCGVCESCVEITSGQSVDVFEIDGASNTGVEDVRTLREGVRYLPAKGKKKIYIIDEVHMLSTSAFNALLKTLEEPPAHVVFVLATTEVHKIPATILSRCQRYDFKLVPTPRLEAHLAAILKTEAIAVTPDALRLVARQGAGSVRDALSLLDQVIAYVGKDTITRDITAEVLGVADRAVLIAWARAVIARDLAAALRLLASAAGRGVDLGQMAKAFLALLRDLEVVATVEGEIADLVDATDDEIQEMRDLVAGAEPSLLSTIFDRWARAVDEGGRSQTPRLLYEMALADLVRAEPLVPIGNLLEQLDEIERQLGTGARPQPAAKKAAPSRSPAPAAPSAPAAPPAPARGEAPATTASVPDAIRALIVEFRSSRPRLGALLADARVAHDGGVVTLVYADAFVAQQAEKALPDLRTALSARCGGPVNLTVTTEAPAGTSVARSAGEEEDQARDDDRKRRTEEARSHPMIQKAEAMFGVRARQVKTG